jgi:hypothetical protein
MVWSGFKIAGRDLQNRKGRAAVALPGYYQQAFSLLFLAAEAGKAYKTQAEEKHRGGFGN